MPGAADLLILPLLAGSAALAAWASRKVRLGRAGVYRETAGLVGLRLLPRERGILSTSWPVMTGVVQGMSVEVEEFARDRVEFLRVTVGAPRGRGARVPAGLGLERERSSLGFLSREDVIVGDPAFDERVRVRGGAEPALAALGPEARLEILDALDAGNVLRVADGAVVVELQFEGSPTRLAEEITRAARIATSLLVQGEGRGTGSAGRREALVRRATEDPEPGVRLRALETLEEIGEMPGHAGEVARRLLADPHPEVRLRAAATLGEEGFETLAAVVREPSRTDAGEGRARLWWEIDAGEGRRHELAEVLDITREGHERRRVRALELLVRRFPAELVRPLLREALAAGSRPLTLAALRGVESAGDSSLEEIVVPLLHEPAEEVRVAAVAALGAVGTVTAVPRLRALAGASGTLAFTVRREVDAAVAAIQARLDGAAAGQVSLAGSAGADAGGKLSLAGSTNGRGGLALAHAGDDVGGRVSPAAED